MAKKIKTFNTSEFLNEFMKPEPKLKQIIKPDFGRFFIANVQHLLKLSKLPVPPTRANTHTLIYLTSGEATMKIGFHAVKIYKNECLLVPAGQVFCYEKYDVNQGFICNFDNSFLLGKIGSSDLLKEFEFLSIWGNPIVKPNNVSGRYIKQGLNRVYNEYSEHGLKNENLIQSYFIAILCELNMFYTPLSSSKNKTAVSLTNRFKELLHKNIKTKQLVTDYAALLGVSPNHLNKTVKKITQKSTSKWINETLVLEAKVLLFQTNLTISQIASELGINDQSYFSRLFKKYENCSPLDYRKMIEKS